jgi:hypothetical protein
VLATGHDEVCRTIAGSPIAGSPIVPRRRTPEAEAQIAAAHEPPDAMEIAMQTGIDDALEERAREVRSCDHALLTPGCASCNEREERRREIQQRQAQFLGVRLPDPTRVLTTNHPEVPDPEERARLGLYPIDSVEQPAASGFQLRKRTPAARFEYIMEKYRDGKISREAVVAMVDASNSIGTVTEPTPGFAVPGGGTADFSGAPLAGHASIDTGRGPYRTVQVDESKLRESAPSVTGQRADPATMLFGNDAATLDAFGQVCAALEDHAEKAQALQVAYRNALEQVSRMAARRNRSK